MACAAIRRVSSDAEYEQAVERFEIDKLRFVVPFAARVAREVRDLLEGDDRDFHDGLDEWATACKLLRLRPRDVHADVRLWYTHTLRFRCCRSDAALFDVLDMACYGGAHSRFTALACRAVADIDFTLLASYSNLRVLHVSVQLPFYFKVLVAFFPSSPPPPPAPVA
jgi:hypothetical protein